MYARHITVHVKPGQLDEMIATYQEALSQAPEEARQGYKATYMLVDRERDEVVVVVLWDTQEGATAAAATQWYQNRAKNMAVFFADTPERRFYEVVVDNQG